MTNNNISLESPIFEKKERDSSNLSPKPSKKYISLQGQSPSQVIRFPHNGERIAASGISIPIPSLSIQPIRQPIATTKTNFPPLKPTTMIFDPLLLDDHANKSQGQPKLHARIPLTSKDESNRRHSKSRSLDLSEIMGSIASYPHDGDTEFHKSRMEDHLATLGTKIQQSKDSKTKGHHKRFHSLDLSTLKTTPFRVHTEKVKKSPHNDDERNLPQLVNRITSTRQSFTQPNSNSNRSLFKAPPRVLDNSSSKRLSQLDNKNTVISFADKSQEKLRTSELDPFPHQIDLPTFTDVSINAELCSLLDNYRNVDQNFDFKQMIGLSRLSMEAFVRSGIVPPSCSFVDNHCPIVKTILECTDDLMVEDFFTFGQVDDVDNRVEVAIFKSESRREIITVWRGTTDAQTKPVKNKEVRNFQSKDLKGSFHESFA